MAFENLFKPRHLKRLLLALTAATAAAVIYLTFEHFDVVPGTGAIEEPTTQHTLGDRSIAIMPATAESPQLLSHAVTLDVIRTLVRVPDIEVISVRSALAAASAPRPNPRAPSRFETAHRVEIRAETLDEGVRFSATLAGADLPEPELVLEQLRPETELAGFSGDLAEALGERLGFKPPSSPGAQTGVAGAIYLEYLVAGLLQMGGAEEIQAAGEKLDALLRRAPEWAPGWAAFARNELLMAILDPPLAQLHVEAAREAVEKAAALDADLPEVPLYRSLVAHRHDWQWQQAYASANDALALAPGSAEVLAAASTAAFTLGKFEEAADHLSHAIALDPLSPGHRVRYALALEFKGEYTPAIEAYRELMIFDPDFPGAHTRLARTLVLAGRPQSAMLHAEIENDPFWRVYGMALASEALGRPEEAESHFASLEELHGHEAAVQIAEIHAFANRPDQAFEWLNRAIENRDPGVAELNGNPLLENLRDDPRWAAMLERLELAPVPD